MLKCYCTDGEDLLHLTQYQQKCGDQQVTNPLEENDDSGQFLKQLFHITALQVVNPLEFKEVKMLSVEILAKFPTEKVLPFVLAHLIAFLRDELPGTVFPTAVSWTDTIPKQSCGLVAAKLMVYYLNRVVNEGSLPSDDQGTVASILAVLFLLLQIPSYDNDPNQPSMSLITDLQMGCIDWIAQFIASTSAISGKIDDLVEIRTGLLDLLMSWIWDKGEPGEVENTSGIAHLTRERMDQVSVRKASDVQDVQLQFRLCCCNIMIR